MKNTILLIAFILISVISNAQVLEQHQRMSLGEYPALILEVKEIDEKMVESVWKDFFGNFGRDKKNRKEDEYYVTDAQISPLGVSRAVDLYAKIIPSGANTIVYTWIDMKGGFLSSADYPTEYQNALKLMQDFHLKVRETAVQENLEEQMKLLSRLERDLQTLMKQNERYHSIIEDAKEKIAKAELDIKTNLQEQELKKQEIEAQKATVTTVEEKLKNLTK